MGSYQGGREEKLRKGFLNLGMLMEEEEGEEEKKVKGWRFCGVGLGGTEGKSDRRWRPSGAEKTTDAVRKKEKIICA